MLVLFKHFVRQGKSEKLIGANRLDWLDACILMKAVHSWRNLKWTDNVIVLFVLRNEKKLF